jgi:hypothetical protein
MRNAHIKTEETLIKLYSNKLIILVNDAKFANGFKQTLFRFGNTYFIFYIH